MIAFVIIVSAIVIVLPFFAAVAIFIYEGRVHDRTFAPFVFLAIGVLGLFWVGLTGISLVRHLAGAA